MSKIIDVLKEAAGFKIEKAKRGWLGIGAINRCPQCKCMSQEEYLRPHGHYDTMKEKLESLPWNVVSDPRNPKPEEYPDKDGQYLVMLDCDEHFIITNEYTNSVWTMYHRTHIKWWMPLPDDIAEN